MGMFSFLGSSFLCFNRTSSTFPLVPCTLKSFSGMGKRKPLAGSQLHASRVFCKTPLLDQVLLPTSSDNINKA
jgi:hypothetical protein